MTDTPLSLEKLHAVLENDERLLKTYPVGSSDYFYVKGHRNAIKSILEGNYNEVNTQ